MSEHLPIGRIEFNVNVKPQSANGIRDWKVEHAICQKCHERPATETWSEGSIAYVHGLFQRWCKRCVLTEQLADARHMASIIPDLEAQLAKELEA